MPTKTEPATELLPLLEAGGPDERLFIVCGCQHRAAFHDNLGCSFVTAGKPESNSGGYKTQGTPDVACPCPTPREVVYLGGRGPAPAAEVSK